MPAFAPVDSPDEVELGVGLGVEVDVGVDVRSVDCHIIPTGIAWITGEGYVTTAVVDGVGLPKG